ncbi:hypothetical protein LCGC14_2532150 [marine sediment metagenome]|uniref:Uncharacterized protein n=1 Tax=marine sediment metagenome TaxID=412755 RepID=A0A0F9ATP5_9ZZZZ
MKVTLGNVMETDSTIVVPDLANLLGEGSIPQPWWMPDFWHQWLKQRQRETALSRWKAVHFEPPKEVVRMQIAQELRDLAEGIIGYSDVDPEKSSIVRNKHRVNNSRWLQYCKYDPPKPKKLTKRGERRLIRRVVCESDKKLEAMGIEV